MKASSAYPVDSLRSGNFTQKFGIATSIMDYARYNYVAQPGDKNIRFVRQLGPYDDYSIEWGYRYFGDTPENEREILRKFVDSKSLDPIYMFGGYGNDPNSQTENIGDDPVKASMYGIKNLKIVANNLENWTLEPNANYEDLNEIYGELISVYRRYIYHVHSIIGGIYNTTHNSNQTGVTTYLNTDVSKQREALLFLEDNLWKTQNWLMNKGLISKIKKEGVLASFQDLQIGALNRFLSVSKLNRMLSAQESLLGNALTVEQLLQSLFKAIATKSYSKEDLFEQRLQLHFVDRINLLMGEKDLNPTIKGLLMQLKNDFFTLSKRKTRFALGKKKAHFNYLKSLSNN